MTAPDPDRVRRIDRRRHSFPRSESRADIVMRVAFGFGMTFGVATELYSMTDRFGWDGPYVPGIGLGVGLLGGSVIGLLPGFAVLLVAKEPRRSHVWLGVLAALLVLLLDLAS